MTVTELNPKGFHHKVCVQCSVDPVGVAGPISFDNVLEFIGLPPDCTESLADTSFAPKKLKYTKSETFISIAPSYESIFKHTKQIDCPLTDCKLKDKTCAQEKPSEHV